MGWLIQLIRCSIGKKLLMAVTGISFCGFLLVHLAGNLTLFKGMAAFNSYAENLHRLGLLLTVLEVGLLCLALIHILTGTILFYDNLKARPARYAVSKRAGGRTLGSATMPYTGIILLVFVIFHLFNFSFADKSGRTIFHIVSSTFNHAGYMLVYLTAMAVAAIHISHGLWSAFQTLGISHVKYTPAIRRIGLIFSLTVGIGFGSITIYISMMYK